MLQSGQGDRDREEKTKPSYGKRKSFSISKIIFSFETFEKVNLSLSACPHYHYLCSLCKVH
jgi:hypothetical protein